MAAVGELLRESPGRVVLAYEREMTIAASARRAARTSDRDAAQAILEKGTATMIREVARVRRPASPK